MHTSVTRPARCRPNKKEADRKSTERAKATEIRRSLRNAGTSNMERQDIAGIGWLDVSVTMGDGLLVIENNRVNRWTSIKNFSLKKKHYCVL